MSVSEAELFLRVRHAVMSAVALSAKNGVELNILVGRVVEAEGVIKGLVGFLLTGKGLAQIDLRDP
jgi:hypothetical protein